MVKMIAHRHQYGWTELAKRIDHTLLKPTATLRDYGHLCDDAVAYGFWSVCVPPAYVGMSAARLRGTKVRVCTVVGFPMGFSSSETKRAEAATAIRAGADEIDMVMNIGAFKGGDYDLVSREISEVASECRKEGKTLKVIIECCYLTNEEKALAARLAERNGADYIKTSTGYGKGGATPEDVRLIRSSLSGGAKVKAAGGIGDLASALRMLEAGADRIGTSSGVKIIDEARELARRRPAPALST